MREAKNTQRALVKIGFDGKVHKWFRGPKATERFENEVQVLKYLEHRKCPFVPRLLSSEPDTLKIVTTNCGAIVEHISDDRAAEVFEELLQFGVRHDDPYPRNITYRPTDGRFCAIDFEFATIMDEAWAGPKSASENPLVPMAGHVAWSGRTDRGKLRPNNEDAFLVLKIDRSGIRYLSRSGEDDLQKSDFVFAVSDGMGGENSGEFASRISLDKITTRLPAESASSEACTLTYGGEVLEQLFRSIHQAMLDLGEYDDNCRDMGATLTLVWVRNGHAFFAHVGDSRLYVTRASGEMEQVTEDHSHVGWLRRSGQINEREARLHPRKNALDQALGAGHRFLRPHIGELKYQVGDKLILVSDGVIDGLWDHRIESVAREESVGDAADQLVDQAVAESGRDNATAVVVEFRD